MQLDPPTPVSIWSDRITIFPKSVADYASLKTTLDLVARVPDALGDRDVKIINRGVNKDYAFTIDDVIKSDTGLALDLTIKVAPSARGSLGITKIKLTHGVDLWAEMDLSKIDLLAEGMMISAAIREALRVLQPAPVAALAILQDGNPSEDFDIEIMEMIAKVFSSNPASTRYLNAELMDPILEGSILTTSSAYYTPSRGQRLNINGAPRVRYARSYDPISREFSVQFFHKSVVPSLVNDLGDYVFVSVLNKGRAFSIDCATRLNHNQYSPPYDSLSVMSAIKKLTAIKDIIQEDTAA